MKVYYYNGHKKVNFNKESKKYLKKLPCSNRFEKILSKSVNDLNETTHFILPFEHYFTKLF